MWLGVCAIVRTDSTPKTITIPASFLQVDFSLARGQLFQTTDLFFILLMEGRLELRSGLTVSP